MGLPISYKDPSVAVFISLLGFFSPQSHATESCSESVVCVRTQDSPGSVMVETRNLSEFVLTLTVSFQGTNLKLEEQEKTVVVDGQSTVKLWDLSIDDPSADYDYQFRYDWAFGDKNAQPEDYTYALPYASGKSYSVMQGFQSNFSHTGLERYAVDFDMQVGTPVHAAREGVVSRVVKKHDKGCWADGCGKFANFIVILHQDGTTGEYYHLMKNGAVVTVGDQVARGQHIGYSGNTGHSTRAHLHFAVYRPTSWGKTESLPMVFDSQSGIVLNPKVGSKYVAE